MSNEDLINFNFQTDEQDQTNNYTASDMQWIYLNDLNQGNYSQGWVNFSNLNVIGSGPQKYFDWSQAYVMIPHGVVLSVAGTATRLSFGNQDATPTYTHLAENAFAIGLKGSQHIVDLVQAKFSGASINRNSNFNNFVMNENLKKKTNDQAKLLYDILGFEWDGEDSYTIGATLGDVNNNTVSTVNLGGGLNNSTYTNTGHIKRMRYCNNDNSSTGNLFKTTGGVYTGTSLTNSLQEGLVGVFNINGNTVTPITTVASNSPITHLMFQYVSVIPLAELHNFYKQLPAVQSSLGFELRLQLNVATGNSWTVQGTRVADDNFYPLTGVVSNQSVGNTCPYLLSRPARGIKGTGLNISTSSTNDAQTVNVTATSFIGYYAGATLGANGLPTGSTAIPCRIYVPQISYTPSYSKMLLDNPLKNILYEDYYVDSIKNIQATGSTQVQRLFNVNLAKVRNMYIIPFLSSGTSYPISYQSLLSSAPNTCSLCRLSNFNIQIGGVNIFSEPMQYINQFYIHNVLPLLAQENGNSIKSQFFSGQISKSMWEKAYNVHSLDLRRVADEVQDSQSKSFQLTFKVDTIATYDFIIIVTFQNSLTIDRVSGMITA